MRFGVAKEGMRGALAGRPAPPAESGTTVRFGDVKEVMRGARIDLGRAVQVEPMKPMLEAPGTKRLKLQYDEPPAHFAFIQPAPLHLGDLKTATGARASGSGGSGMSGRFLASTMVGRCWLTQI